MPRYYFDVYNDFDSHDEQGVELADLAAVRHQVRQTLPALIQDIQPSRDSAQFRVDVRDENGRRVVTSTILMVMQCVEMTEDAATTKRSSDRPEAFHRGAP